MEGGLVAEDGRRNFVDIADLMADLAFPQEFPQTDMVEVQEVDKVEDSRLVESEDRSVMAVVIDIAA